MNRDRRFTPEERLDVLAALGDLERWDKDCHAASIHLVKTRIFPDARVARGSCRGVGSQHSWVVLGNPYDPDAIVDPTLWSYVPDVTGVVFADAAADKRAWVPHGSGSIFRFGCPASGDGEEMVPPGLSREAEVFLDLCRSAHGSTLDRRFWAGLFNSPMGGWPSAEIIEACAKDRRFSALIPIDVVGMLTDLDPGGLYLAGEVVEA